MVRVEGVEATLSQRSHWRDDGSLHYFSADQPHYGYLDVITLQVVVGRAPPSLPRSSGWCTSFVVMRTT